MSATASGSGVAFPDQPGSETAEEFVRSHPGLVKASRVGWVAKGVVYGLTGVLALLVALRPPAGNGDPGTEASQTGAIANVARQPAGVVLLYVLAIGLLAYVAWRAVTIVLPAKNDLHTWGTRFGYLISLLTYLALSWSALSIARGVENASGTTTEDSRVERLTRSLMSHTGGRYLVAVAGLVLLGIAAHFVWKGWKATFRRQLILAPIGPVPSRYVVIMGRVGWVGRGLMLGLIGFFLIQAAWRVDPAEAQGLDGSLRHAASSPVGTALVLVVALTLVIYGLFCVISAPRQRLVPADV